MQQPLSSVRQRPRTPPAERIDRNQYSGTLVRGAPSSPVRIKQPSIQVQPAQAANIEGPSNGAGRGSSTIARKPVGSRPGLGDGQPTVHETNSLMRDEWQLPSTFPIRDHSRTTSEPLPTITPPRLFAAVHEAFSIPLDQEGMPIQDPQPIEQLQYHHDFEPAERKPLSTPDSHARLPSRMSASPGPSSNDSPGVAGKKSSYPLSRPGSAMTLGSDLYGRGRSVSPQDFRSDTSLSPGRHSRGVSNGRSPDSRVRGSTADLLNIPYSQQMAHQNLALDNALLRSSVGGNASLLDTRKTLDMYRANVKKTNDSQIQYEFAIFMVSAAQEAAASTDATQRDASSVRDSKDREHLLTEARQILQKLADRSFVYAQYYLADGYFSGLFNRGKQDLDRAFPLFVSAGKHGHAEASYRAALCYEFGWGCRKDYAKAVQYYRQAATKNHPGAATRLGRACMQGEMGLGGRYREGVKWLKRATESADQHHNQAPYELGLLHIHGYGDDIFKDESYAAQLLTKAAELGHPEASLRMGEAYEHGLLTCPKDPALSIHFYTGAAQAGIPKAMMALCAWYMVGAEPVLEKDEAEAYEWAKQSAEAGYRKAEYAIGYFTEMGIGCRGNPLEANVWYVRAADHGEEHAKQRLAIIRAAEMGDTLTTGSLQPGKGPKKKKSSGAEGGKEGDKDCTIM